MKKLSEIGAFIFIGVIIISAVVAIILSGSRASHVHYVCLELNPRVEFLADSHHKVKSIKPLNVEAKELLIDEEFVGLPMTEACNKFMTLCAKAGYLKVDGNNNAVKLSVLSGLTQELELRLAQTINKFFVDNNILGILVESSQDLQQYKDAKKQKVDFEKYDLMLAVKENFPDISLDELKKLSNQKLVEKIEESHKEYRLDYTEEELANKVALIDFYRDVYNNHVSNISNDSTRKFKEDLKEFRAKKTRDYKINYNKKYNEWLFG